MATVRFNAFLYKSLSYTAVHGTVNPTILSTRTFAKSPSSTKKTTTKKSTKAASKPKKVTKKDEKLQKLLKQYPDPKKPSRPLTAYFRFAADYRNKNKSSISPATIGTVAKSIGAAWRKLPDYEKSKYTQATAADSAKYKEAKKRYDESERPQQWLDKIIKLSKEKPPNSGYQLFMKKRLPVMKERNAGSPQPQILSVM